MDVFFEYLIIFIVLWVFHYILVIRPKLNNKNSKKGKKNNNITELMYLKSFIKLIYRILIIRVLCIFIILLMFLLLLLYILLLFI